MSCAQVPCHQIRAFGRSAEASSALELSDRHPINSSCSAGGSARGLTTGRLGNSHADGARGLNAVRSALFAFVAALCIPNLHSSPVSATNERRLPVFTDEKARPRAPSVYASLLADRASHPRARAPTRGACLARSFIPWIRLLGFRIAHAGVVSAPTKAA